MQFGPYTPESFKRGYRQGEQRARDLDTAGLSAAVRSLRGDERYGILTVEDTGYLRALEHALNVRRQVAQP